MSAHNPALRREVIAIYKGSSRARASSLNRMLIIPQSYSTWAETTRKASATSGPDSTRRSWRMPISVTRLKFARVSPEQSLSAKVCSPPAPLPPFASARASQGNTVLAPELFLGEKQLTCGSHQRQRSRHCEFQDLLRTRVKSHHRQVAYILCQSWKGDNVSISFGQQTSTLRCIYIQSGNQIDTCSP